MKAVKQAKYIDRLSKLVTSKDAVIAFVGLGYVGLPNFLVFTGKKFKTIGIDLFPDRLNKIKKGISPIQGKEPGLAEMVKKISKQTNYLLSTSYQHIRKAHIVIIAVQTPINENHIPEYKHLKTAVKEVAKNLSKGSLVIVESTIAPGTITNVVIPMIEKTRGWKLNEDFYVGHCPERVMPGKLIHNLTTYARVVGGSTPEVSKLMAKLYRNATSGELDLTDYKTAEVVKTAENAFRDVQIAFSNQLALVAEQTGVNVFEARKLINKVEGRNVLMPGAGVGGHCIPKDPWLFIHPIRGRAHTSLIESARELNTHMPLHMAELTERALKEAGVDLDEATLAVLGYAYNADSDDARDTPTETLLAHLSGRRAKVRVHDPYVAPYQVELEKVLHSADAVLVMVGHSQYKSADVSVWGEFLRHKIIVDGRGAIDKVQARSLGFKYLGIGNL